MLINKKNILLFTLQIHKKPKQLQYFFLLISLLKALSKSVCPRKIFGKFCLGDADKTHFSCEDKRVI